MLARGVQQPCCTQSMRTASSRSASLVACSVPTASSTPAAAMHSPPVASTSYSSSFSSACAIKLRLCRPHGHHRCTVARSAAGDTLESMEEPEGPTKMASDLADALSYAIKLAWTSETYLVHSWMVLLGLLRNEKSIACQVLQRLGLEDLYGAWNEVLWALNVSDGLEPRAFTAQMEWGARALRLTKASLRFAHWAGREEVRTQDLLMAFAADGAMTDLFPDLDLGFDRVKRAVESATGDAYELPGYEPGPGALASEDNFL